MSARRRSRRSAGRQRPARSPRPAHCPAVAAPGPVDAPASARCSPATASPGRPARRARRRGGTARPTPAAKPRSCHRKRGSSAAGDPGHPHPPRLAGEHVEVAQHERGDLREHLRAAAAGPARRSRSRVVVVAASSSEASTPSVPLARMFHAPHRPVDGQRQARAPRPASPAAEERQEHGEQHERQLDQRRAAAATGRHPGQRRDDREQHGVHRRRPRTPRAGWPPRRWRTAPSRRACTSGGSRCTGECRCTVERVRVPGAHVRPPSRRSAVRRGRPSVGVRVACAGAAARTRPARRRR